MMSDRFQQQIRFVVEIDKLKHIVRQTVLTDCSRQENDAEHSWHIAVMAMLFGEYAAEAEVDLLRVMKMVVIHDLVEIDAGDTYCYDAGEVENQGECEQASAERLFNMLPRDQATEFRTLWDEFEAHTTPESRYAAALDRLQPLLHNYTTKGFMWKKHGIKKHQVIARNETIKDGAPFLWRYASHLIEDAVLRGYLDE